MFNMFFQNTKVFCLTGVALLPTNYLVSTMSLYLLLPAVMKKISRRFLILRLGSFQLF